MEATGETVDVRLEPTDDVQRSRRRRNLVGFWILGLCNNFAYVIMLSAAKDIIEKDHDDPKTNGTHVCREAVTSRDCFPISTGSVLLADILPALLVKLTAPLFIHSLPFGLRHALVVFLQAASFSVVGMSTSMGMALFGVVLASAGSGLGEISYLALTSHFDGSVISSWSSGTGGAGIFGSLVYALLTDPLLLNVSPKNSMFLMLVLPALFSYTYWNVLRIPHTVQRVYLLDPRSYVVTVVQGSREVDSLIQSEVVDVENASSEPEERVHEMSWAQKSRLYLRLLKYMVPLVAVYFGEYFINQGMLELLEFDCSHGLRLSPTSQYRWYQLGVFVSRSSSEYVTIPTPFLAVLAALQLLNGAFFTAAAVFFFLPHIVVALGLIFYEGLLGGGAYVNTFRAVHREVPMRQREYSMGFVSISDTVGIVFAGFAAIPAHNLICRIPI